MPINVNQYRAVKGMFKNRSFVTTYNSFYVKGNNSVIEMSLPYLATNLVVLFFLLFHVYFHQKN